MALNIRKSEREHWAFAHGTDRMYLDWLKTQPSCLSGGPPCDPAHVRRAHNSGFGMKPPFSAVPLTRAQHQMQHSMGESGLLTSYFGVEISREHAKARFDAKAEYYLNNWIREKNDENK